MTKRILLILMVVLSIALGGCDYLEGLGASESSSEQVGYLSLIHI